MESEKNAKRAIKISIIGLIILFFVALIGLSILITQTNAMAQMSKQIVILEQKVKALENNKKGNQ